MTTLIADQIFIRKLTEIILANLANDHFGVRELVTESGISLYSLSRRLNRINKKTINQFIREVRLQEALKMLQIESYTASEIAYKVGFSSPAYFSKCFHEFFGYPPGKAKIADSDIAEEHLSVPEARIKGTYLPFHLTYKNVLSVVLILLVSTLTFIILVYPRIFKKNVLQDLRSLKGNIYCGNAISEHKR